MVDRLRDLPTIELPASKHRWPTELQRNFSAKPPLLLGSEPASRSFKHRQAHQALKMLRSGWGPLKLAVPDHRI